MIILPAVFLFVASVGGFAFGFTVLAIGNFLMKKSHVLYGPVFIPSKNEDLETMIELANIKLKEKVVDLGSGDGKVVIELAKRGIRADGFENSPTLVFSSRKRIEKLGMSDKITIHFQDFWKADFSQYDVVMMYTSQDTMEKLEKRILEQLKPGSRVVSNTFEFPNWKMATKKGKIFLYEKD